MSCDDFQGIAISPIISKVFEHCVLDRFQNFFLSSDAQFGFKKGVGCSNAIYYTVCTIVGRIIERGDTVNICAIDKAFDKVNHSSLFMKLMKRYIPIELLQLLENWLSDSTAGVKWGNSWSQIFKISSGVRQGSVLSPFLLMILLSYKIIGLVNSLYCTLMTFCYCDGRSQHSRNCYGLVSRNTSQLIWLLTLKIVLYAYRCEA